MPKVRHRRRGRRGWIRRLVPGSLIGPLRWLKARLTPHGRMRIWLERNRSGLLLQPSSETRRNRHPELFALARERLAGIPAPRLLSYGCSTGEEAFTLAEYLPRALIDAIDINPRSIAIAKRSLGDAKSPSLRFACASSPPGNASVYDAIFCLSVLRHGRPESEQMKNCSEVLPFARFAEAIDALDHALKPGGLLFLWGCNFRFADTPTAMAYRRIATPQKRPEFGMFYGPDNDLLAIASNADFVFEKRAAAPASLPASVSRGNSPEPGQ